MKYTAVFLFLSLSLTLQAQTGIIAELRMSDNDERSITVYDLREFSVRIELLNELGVPYVDLADLPSALVDSAKTGRIQAFDLGLYFTSEGYGFKVRSNILTPARLDEMIHTKSGEFVAEPYETFLIGIETDGDMGKYFHLFVHEREGFYDLIANGTQFSDYVVSYRFEDLQFLYFR